MPFVCAPRFHLNPICAGIDFPAALPNRMIRPARNSMKEFLKVLRGFGFII
jgi:hypothetical protein